MHHFLSKQRLNNIMKNRKFFTIVFSMSLGTLFLPNSVKAQCIGPDPDLGNDTAFCAGQSLTLNPGTFSSYLWNNGSTLPTRTVSQAGTYSVQVGIPGENIIVNGDFEAGNTGFLTDYVVGVAPPFGGFGQLTNEGTYAVTTSPSLAHNNFMACQDHTPAPGTQMMVVNGSSTANTNVWCQTVPVDPNTTYNFGTWVSNALNDNNVAQLQFSINGSTLGSVFSPPTTGCNWVQFQQQWLSGVNVSAQICIKNQSTLVSGNDFMIDDITFAPICYKYDTIVVATNPAPIITATPNDTVCVGELSNITASSLNAPLNYTWNPGAINSATLNVSPATTTIYSVTATDQNNCVSNLLSRTVVVLAAPTVNIVSSDAVICEGNQVFMTAVPSNPNVTYLWTPAIGTIASVNDAPLVPTNYSVIVESPNGCLGHDTVFVDVIPSFIIDISGNLTVCEGQTTLLTVTGNNPNLVYQWSDGTVGAQNLLTPLSSGEISVTGNYFGCPQAKDSVEIQVNNYPIVTISDDVVVCPGEDVLSTATTSISGSTIHWLPSNITGSSISTTALASMYVYVYADNQGCVSGLDSMFIDVSAACFVDIPNVFTPNSDGSNDFFSLVSYDGIEKLDCSILNRWGNSIRDFSTPNFLWDGTDKSGLPVEEGVYFYKITGVTNANESFEKQGFVQLVRN